MRGHRPLPAYVRYRGQAVVRTGSGGLSDERHSGSRGLGQARIRSAGNAYGPRFQISQISQAIPVYEAFRHHLNVNDRFHWRLGTLHAEALSGSRILRTLQRG